VANGDSDPMILPHYCYLLAGLIPLAKAKIYPDPAHGFLFQHHTEFAADLDADGTDLPTDSERTDLPVLVCHEPSVRWRRACVLATPAKNCPSGLLA
jgi:hypothetical protein